MTHTWCAMHMGTQHHEGCPSYAGLCLCRDMLQGLKGAQAPTPIHTL
jgi:hypothetical protein